MRAVFCIVQDDRPPIPPEITGDLCRFLHRCFIKDPEKRASAKELMQHPYIANAKLPQTTSSGKLDAKGLKKTLKAYHGAPMVDTPPGSVSSSAAPSPPASTSLKISVKSAPPPAEQTLDHVVIPLGNLESSSSSKPSTPRGADASFSQAATPVSPRNVAVVKNTASATEPDPHAPVPSIQKYDDNERTNLLQGHNKEKYSAEGGDDSSPCCTIL